MKAKDYGIKCAYCGSIRKPNKMILWNPKDSNQTIAICRDPEVCDTAKKPTKKQEDE